jgi:hypothetical protein
MSRILVPMVWLTLSLLVPPTVQADLRFLEPAANAGEVRSGIPLAHRFGFINEGPEEVTIAGLRASCGCIKPRLDRRTYAPGEKGSLVLDVHTLGESAGDHTWHLHVSYSCGKATREASLALHGRVVREIVVQPAALTLFTSGSIGHQITLTDLRKHALTIAAVRTTSPVLKAQVSHTSQDPSGHRVVTIGLAVDPGCPEGRFEEIVALVTDDNTYAELRVPVTVVKRPRQRVTASPGTVTLAAPPSQPLPSRIVLLRPAGEDAVAVDQVASDDSAVVCTWASGPGNFVTLKVSVNRAHLSGDSFRSAVHVHLSKPVRETLTIPVVCLLE